MKLYTSPGACSMADHIVLEWTGAPYSIHLVSRDDRKAPWFLALNPLAGVPVFEEDGWVLTQNAAILNYLADKFPAAKLAGDGTPRARAEVNRWLGFLNADVHPEFRPLFGSTAYLNDEAFVEKSKENARTKLRALFARCDERLGESDWLAGSRSVADAYLFVMKRWAPLVNVDLSGLGNLERFEKRMLEDPAVRKVMKAEGVG